MLKHKISLDNSPKEISIYAIQIHVTYSGGSELMAGVAAKPRAAIDARIAGGLDTDYDLYKVINKKPGHSIYELAKEMGWSSGKVYGSVQRLEKEGLVHTEKDIRGGRSILKVHAADWSEFFTKEELEEFDNLEF
jgi:predicted transcriptional regulator